MWRRDQVLVNIGSNGMLFFFNLGIGLWLVPYLIDHLGVAAYGLVPLATTLTAYLGLITLSLNSALGRFLAIELERGNASSANVVFNTGFATSILLCGVVAIAGGVIVSLAPWLLKLPQGQHSEARRLFAMATGAFILTTIESNFSISSWARNRLDLRNAVTALSRVVQVGVLVVLFSTLRPAVSYVGLAMVIASAFSLAGSILLWRYLTPELHIRIASFDRSRLSDLTRVSGWMLVNQIGSLLFLNADIVLVNRLFGGEAAGRYGALWQLSAYVRGMANVLVSALAPVILAAYARGDFESMNRISEQSVRLLGFIMAIPVGLLCGFSKPFLKIWLGPPFESTAPLLVVLCAHLAVNLVVPVFFSIQIAYVRVRWPAVVTLIMGLANLSLAAALARPGGWGIMGVASAGAITLTLKNAFFTPVYSALIQNSRWCKFLPTLVPGLAGASVVATLAYLVSRLWVIDCWTRLALMSVAVSCVYLGVAYLLGISAEERALIRRLVRKLV